MAKRNSLLILWLVLFPAVARSGSFERYRTEFIRGYLALHIPEFSYDYVEYFRTIPTMESLKEQEAFFRGAQRALLKLPVRHPDERQRLNTETLRYEIRFNLERIRLEERWVARGRRMPLNGLYGMADSKAWYGWFIKKFTTTDILPEDVFTFGQREVRRTQQEIKRIQQLLGLSDSAAFYSRLRGDQFFITDKNEIAGGFKRIDSIVRAFLPAFLNSGPVPELYPVQWPGAGPATPPGMYLNHADNAYGKDVFQYNLYGGRYNRRAMEWLYLHEGIPGHHLQSSIRQADSLQDLFLYPGNFEGWACYVEYYGKDLGLYTDLSSELGKWEWDLVRSARLVIETGIHYYGWTKEQALAYWRANIAGQEDIAEREVNRVANWPGQSLSYKIGAEFIFRLQTQWQRDHPGKGLPEFRSKFVSLPAASLTVLGKLLK